MFVIGITGGIGSGKSSAASVFANLGIRVLDADAISRDITGTSGRSIEPIRALLGDKAVNASGGLNRKFVASLVFSNRTLLDKLSAIIHKEVLAQIGEELELEREKGTKVIVLDVPIPVQRGFVDICNQIWVISCDDAIRLARLSERGMSKDDAIRRMDMQMTREEYEALADIVIVNDGDEEELHAAVLRHMKEEFGKRGIRI